MIVPLSLQFFSGPSTSVVTSFTPFSFSISISIGSAPAVPSAVSPRPQQIANKNDNGAEEVEMYTPQMLVIGTLFAVLMVQMGTSLAQVVQARWRRRGAGAVEIAQTPAAAEQEREREQPGAVPEGIEGGDGAEGRAGGPTGEVE